jgi:hypothetical protein
VNTEIATIYSLLVVRDCLPGGCVQNACALGIRATGEAGWHGLDRHGPGLWALVLDRLSAKARQSGEQRAVSSE